MKSHLRLGRRRLRLSGKSRVWISAERASKDARRIEEREREREKRRIKASHLNPGESDVKVVRTFFGEKRLW